MLSMVKPQYVEVKDYKVIEHTLPGDTLDEQLNSMKKGRTVIAGMALSLYELDASLKDSVIRALGVKVNGNSAKGVKMSKHVTDSNMKLLLYKYAKRVARHCKDSLPKVYEGILEQYPNITSDTILSGTPLKEYIEYMEILVNWFGLPEQFHEVETLKLEADGTYTVSFTKSSDFVTRRELESEVDQLKRQLREKEAEAEELKARAEKAEEERKKAEEEKLQLQKLTKAKLFDTENQKAVEVTFTYTTRYQIGVGATSPKDKVDLHPETVFQVPLFTDTFNELCKSTQDAVVQYVAKASGGSSSLDVQARYRFEGDNVNLKEVFEKSKQLEEAKKAQRLSSTQDPNMK